MFKFTGLTKMAEREEPGWGAKQIAAGRAMRKDLSDKSLSNKLIADPELIGERVKGQLSHGIPGLALGTAAGVAYAKKKKNP
tara:strand:- start:269 stop:514 length:246 start_codon:yes stop_codon:yes gene_type:complete